MLQQHVSPSTSTKLTFVFRTFQIEPKLRRKQLQQIVSRINLDQNKLVSGMGRAGPAGPRLADWTLDPWVHPVMGRPFTDFSTITFTTLHLLLNSFLQTLSYYPAWWLYHAITHQFTAFLTSLSSFTYTFSPSHSQILIFKLFHSHTHTLSKFQIHPVIANKFADCFTKQDQGDQCRSPGFYFDFDLIFKETFKFITFH